MYSHRRRINVRCINGVCLRINLSRGKRFPFFSGSFLSGCGGKFNFRVSLLSSLRFPRLVKQLLESLIVMSNQGKGSPGLAVFLCTGEIL